MIAFEARKMLPEDAYDITMRMWQPGAAELDRIGQGTAPPGIVEKFIRLGSLEYGFTFFANGERVAICGAEKVDGTYYSWFMAVPEIANIGREFTLWLRKYCRDLVEQENEELEMYSASLHPNSDRWFAALGFARGDQDMGIFRHYRYVRKNKLTENA